MILVASRAKRPVELFVGTNPNPEPNVAFESAGDSAAVSRYANGPETGVPAQTLQMQTWMRRIIGKFFVSKTGRTLGFWQQRVVTPPKVVGATRYNTGCSPATRNAPPRQETRPTSLPF